MSKKTKSSEKTKSRKWSAAVTENIHALDLKQYVFELEGPKKNCTVFKEICIKQ